MIKKAIQKYIKLGAVNCFMRELDFLNKLNSLGLFVFDANEARKILNKSEGYTYLYLHRLIRRRRILRIYKGKYALKGVNQYIVASSIVHPSYISLLSAFSLYHLTTQIPRTISVISPKQRPTITYKNYKIEFVRFSKKRIFGFKKVRHDGGIITIGEKEKVIIDSLYLPGSVGFDEVSSALKGVDFDKLERYALRMHSNTLIKRLGFLLEAAGLEPPISFLRIIDNKYVPLNPCIPKKGEKNKRWKVIVNEVF